MSEERKINEAIATVAFQPYIDYAPTDFGNIVALDYSSARGEHELLIHVLFDGRLDRKLPDHWRRSSVPDTLLGGVIDTLADVLARGDSRLIEVLPGDLPEDKIFKVWVP